MGKGKGWPENHRRGKRQRRRREEEEEERGGEESREKRATHLMPIGQLQKYFEVKAQRERWNLKRQH